MKERFNNFKIESNFVNAYVISTHETSTKRFAGIKPEFLDRILKIKKTARLSEKEYLNSIKSLLLSVPLPDKKLKIECVDINSRRGFSAKDIEVYLGQELESLGTKIDIEKPEILCYVILFDMTCHIGFESYKKLRFVDSGRHYKQLSSKISRAEFKLMEAFDEFKIKIKGKKFALDLGAAPGGWSVFLAKQGFNVLAIDQGELNVKNINDLKIEYMEFLKDQNTDIDKLLSKYQILHVKDKFQSLLENKIATKFLLMTCDMNISPSEASQAVLLFKNMLVSGGALIFTIKCKTLYAKNFIEEAVGVLSKDFEILQILALPNNRQELTLYAKKKKRNNMN